MTTGGLHPKFMVYKWELSKHFGIFCVGEIRKLMFFFGPSACGVLLALVALMLLAGFFAFGFGIFHGV